MLNVDMSHNLKSLKGHINRIVQRTDIAVIQGDIRSLDYESDTSRHLCYNYHSQNLKYSIFGCLDT